MQQIIMPILIFGALGAAFGIILAFFSKVFAISKDEKQSQIESVLPNANCGGCGFSGCNSFAENVLNGKAKTNGCPVGGSEVARKIADIIGVAPEQQTPMVAKLKCHGTCDKAKNKYNYDGIQDCIAASTLAGGAKACAYACLGLGTCVQKCKFGAITIHNGIAVINHQKCTSCGACIKICPKNVITLQQKSHAAMVVCNSHNKGAITKQICQVGCIGCKICAKTCPESAITITDNLATIDSSKCTSCGACAAKCPQNAILV